MALNGAKKHFVFGDKDNVSNAPRLFPASVQTFLYVPKFDTLYLNKNSYSSVTSSPN